MSKSNEPAGPRTHSAAGPAGIRYGEGVDVVSDSSRAGVVKLERVVIHRRPATRRPGRDDERRHRRAVRQETKKK